jgi:hypothetical protein
MKKNGGAYVDQYVIAVSATMRYKPKKFLGTIGNFILTPFASPNDFMSTKSAYGKCGNSLGSSLCYG